VTLRVLITCPQMQRYADEYRDRLAARGIELAVPSVVQQLDERTLMSIIGDFDGVIAGDDPFTSEVLACANRLRVISKWGVGVDSIDRAAAAGRGIKVTNTPGVFGDEVADVIVGYLVMLARQLHRTDAGTRSGGWPKIEGFSLTGRTLGIVGLGTIGLALARRATAMGMELVGTDIVVRQQDLAPEHRVAVTSLERVLEQADIVTLCCPLTTDNRHMLDAAAFARMKMGAFLINTARGPLVDERALVEALRTGRLAGAALDVFEIEPLPAGSPLRALESVILGAHNASNSVDAVRRVNELAVKNLLTGLGVAQ
jgi:phosphoglycerate dehydrogenase-like enzyme